jgi:hypothetical protein
MSMGDGRYEDKPVINKLILSAQLMEMKISFFNYENNFIRHLQRLLSPSPAPESQLNVKIISISFIRRMTKKLIN